MIFFYKESKSNFFLLRLKIENKKKWELGVCVCVGGGGGGGGGLKSKIKKNGSWVCGRGWSK